jgi:hypothetical protein
MHLLTSQWRRRQGDDHCHATPCFFAQGASYKVMNKIAFGTKKRCKARMTQKEEPEGLRHVVPRIYCRYSELPKLIKHSTHSIRAPVQLLKGGHSLMWWKWEGG